MDAPPTEEPCGCAEGNLCPWAKQRTKEAAEAFELALMLWGLKRANATLAWHALQIQAHRDAVLPRKPAPEKTDG